MPRKPPPGHEAPSHPQIGFAVSAPATITTVKGPGLAKVHGSPVILAREAVFVRTSRGRWKDLFARADILSEGSARDEPVGVAHATVGAPGAAHATVRAPGVAHATVGAPGAAHATVRAPGAAQTTRMWYGTTSLILPADGADPALLAAVAERDIHVRLQALRIARREACLRAPARLGRLACEIQVKLDKRGVRIDVDMQAPLIEWSARSKLAR
jgi:hypothetical protein